MKEPDRVRRYRVPQPHRAQGSSTNPIDIDPPETKHTPAPEYDPTKHTPAPELNYDPTKHTPAPELNYDPTKYRLDYTAANPSPDKDSKSKMRAMMGLSAPTSIFGMSSMGATPTFKNPTSTPTSKTEKLKAILDMPSIFNKKEAFNKPLFTFGASTNAPTQFKFGASFAPATTSTPVISDKASNYRNPDTPLLDNASSLDSSLIITDEVPAPIPIMSLSRSPSEREDGMVTRSLVEEVECLSDIHHVDNVLDQILGPASTGTPERGGTLARKGPTERANTALQPGRELKRDRDSPVQIAPTGKRRRVDNETAQALAADDDDDIQLIPFTPTSYTPSNTPLIDVGIFWDIENLMVPDNVHPANLVNELRRRVIDCQPHFREAEFYVVCDVHRESVRTINQLFEFHVRIVHVPATKQNTSDNVLRDLMVEFVAHHSGKCPRVVLLSGDSDFSHDIHNFTRKERCDVVLVHNPQARESMVDSATSAFLFEELFCGVEPKGWQYDQQRARQKCNPKRKKNPAKTNLNTDIGSHTQHIPNQFPVVTQIPNQTYTPLSTPLSTPSRYTRKNKAPKAAPLGNTPSSRFFNRTAHPDPATVYLNTSASHLPDFIPVQSRAQKFYRQAKRKMLGKGRSPMQAKNIFTKAKNKKPAAIEFRYP